VNVLAAGATALFVVLAGAAVSQQHASASAPAQQSLGGSASVVYDASQPGVLHVAWQVDVTNTDASMAYGGGDYVSFYTSLGLPVLRGATDVAAYGPEGGGLGLTATDPGDGPILIDQVSFDRGVYYGESYHFSLSYDLLSSRAPQLLAAPSYLYFPAVADGASPTDVTIEIPDDPSWVASFSHGDCEDAGAGIYHCAASDHLLVAAFVELSRPADIRTTAATAHVDRGQVSVTVRYFPGEDAWAHHLSELIPAALPVLEQIYGVDYPGALNFVVAERGQQDLAGYEGLFSCEDASACEISLSPVGDDVTTVHELAHFWTERFSDRWMGEGWAEFAAGRAADRLGALISTRYPRNWPEPEVFPLSTWGHVASFITSDRDAQLHEYSGYERSLRFITNLESTIGLPALQAANKAVVESDETTNSRQYLDGLEEASGKRIDDLFLDWVFVASDASLLDQRRTTRERYHEFQDTVTTAGLTVPEPIDRLLRSWTFDKANASIDQAAEALAAYIKGRERVDAPRNLWQRFGMLGRDPRRRLEQSSSAFKDGDFSSAIDQADDARGMVDHAARAALVRLLIAVGLAMLMVGVSWGGSWIWRRRGGRTP
jgi:hypothetical protein